VVEAKWITDREHSLPYAQPVRRADRDGRRQGGPVLGEHLEHCQILLRLHPHHLRLDRLGRAVQRHLDLLRRLPMRRPLQRRLYHVIVGHHVPVVVPHEAGSRAARDVRRPQSQRRVERLDERLNERNAWRHALEGADGAQLALRQ